MAGKSVFYALAVLLLTGSMTVAAWAEFGAADLSGSERLEQDMAQPEVGPIREPMETGAVPEMSEDTSGEFLQDAGDEPTVEINGKSYRTNIDLVP